MADSEVRLPSDLITDILTRLPVKSLLQFRSVSKPWCSLIDSPLFINLHLNKSLRTNSNNSLIIKSSDPLSSLDFDPIQNLTPIPHPFLPDFVVALDCCNGLLLLQRLRGFLKISLFNPSTRKYFNIPSCDFDRPQGPHSNSRFGFGLGFDHVTDDYKVIRLVDPGGDDDMNWVGSESRVYSLKSNSWKKIKLFPYRLPGGQPWGVSLQGGYNTIVKKYSGRDWPKLLISIDFATYDYKTLPLPDIPDEGLEGLSLGKLGNCLCLSVLFVETSHQEFWVMKEYGVGESWTKLLSTPAPGIQFDSMTIIAYSKCGDKILFTYGNSEFVWFDLKRRDFARIPVSGVPPLFNSHPVSGLPPPFDCYLCVDSLVQPDVYRKFANNEESEQKTKEKKTRKQRDNFLSMGFKLKL